VGATALPVPASAAPSTERISVDRAGRPGDAPSNSAAVSATGRFVTFASSAANLVPGDTNGYTDIFLRDRVTGTIERVSVGSAGVQADGGSVGPARVSPDGRFVSFASSATNLAPGATGDTFHVYLRDRASNTTRRVSVASGGVVGNANSFNAAVSANGRFVAFGSHATNLVAGDTNGRQDIFVRDVRHGTTQRVSVAGGGRIQGDGESSFPMISSNGRYVGFLSAATNLGPVSTSGVTNAYVKDLGTGSVDLVSVPAAGGTFERGTADMSMSGDGRLVAFVSNELGRYGAQVYVRDRSAGTTILASRAFTGGLSDGTFSRVSISANGRYVAFESGASDLVPGSPRSTLVYVRDLQTATTAIGGVTSSGRYIDAAQWEPAMSNAGVAFYTFASDVAPGGDDRHPYQVYFRQF
jgi:Tol biopolymer transport system component